jgi:hypothetical protein
LRSDLITKKEIMKLNTIPALVIVNQCANTQNDRPYLLYLIRKYGNESITKKAITNPVGQQSAMALYPLGFSLLSEMVFLASFKPAM